MADRSGIQWTDATWSPVTGCSKVSPGCAHCYAEGVANRFWAKQYPPVMDPPDDVIDGRPRVFTDVQCHEDRLDQPLRWKKPRKVFVNSMSDLFHEDVHERALARVAGLTPAAAYVRGYGNGYRRAYVYWRAWALRATKAKAVA